MSGYIEYIDICIYIYIYIYVCRSLYTCIRLFSSGRKWPRPAWSKVAHRASGRVHRKATANLTQRAPRPRIAATTKPTKNGGEGTQSQACDHVVWRRRRGGRGVALRLQPEVLQSKSREDKTTATRRSTARREHTVTGLRPRSVLPEDRHEVTRSPPGLVKSRLPGEVQCQGGHTYIHRYIYIIIISISLCLSLSIYI